MPKGYDFLCESLGCLFLGDELELMTPDNITELSQEIQDTIEGFISSKQE